MFVFSSVVFFFALLYQFYMPMLTPKKTLPLWFHLFRKLAQKSVDFFLTKIFWLYPPYFSFSLIVPHWESHNDCHIYTAFGGNDLCCLPQAFQIQQYSQNLHSHFIMVRLCHFHHHCLQIKKYFSYSKCEEYRISLSSRPKAWFRGLQQKTLRELSLLSLLSLLDLLKKASPFQLSLLDGDLRSYQLKTMNSNFWSPIPIIQIQRINFNYLSFHYFQQLSYLPVLLFLF